ncbi:hypothetical protein BU251_05465 [Candidatus Velamenicoccus archaeovorus]|uniref:Uncharacterized protein n=1 Tax=Velamenicoccus archaeovorus TaxID=1930593 RepID=A0A410P557_VELA1|nr:hypothetical protein BU251_05465 [Candidatus Velamenicoccus archaeovorus]
MLLKHVRHFCLSYTMLKDTIFQKIKYTRFFRVEDMFFSNTYNYGCDNCGNYLMDTSSRSEEGKSKSREGPEKSA